MSTLMERNLMSQHASFMEEIHESTHGDTKQHVQVGATVSVPVVSQLYFYH
jgi:hypothetical protein